MDLRTAQEEFARLVDRVDLSTLPDFLHWVENAGVKQAADAYVSKSNADVVIESIKEDLRQSLPVDALSPGENIICPTAGMNADCSPATTVHVDSFLYDEERVDALCDEGKMSRNYCKACGSHNTAPLTFISHSASQTQLKYIFQHLLDNLHSKTVLDVGSRTGAVLYGAYYYSSAPRIIGVEINPFFCELQQKVCEKYSLGNRIQVICADICSKIELLKEADVVIFNNVFEFFVPPPVQSRIWKLIHEHIRRPGVLIVSVPSLEESIEHLQTNIDLLSWLEPVDTEERLLAANKAIFGQETSEDSDLADVHLYQVR